MKELSSLNIGDVFKYKNNLYKKVADGVRVTAVLLDDFEKIDVIFAPDTMVKPVKAANVEE